MGNKADRADERVVKVEDGIVSILFMNILLKGYINSFICFILQELANKLNIPFIETSAKVPTLITASSLENEKKKNDKNDHNNVELAFRIMAQNLKLAR